MSEGFFYRRLMDLCYVELGEYVGSTFFSAELTDNPSRSFFVAVSPEFFGNRFMQGLVMGDTVDGRNPAPPGMYKTL